MPQKIPACFTGLEHLATSVILLNASRQVIYMNPSAEALFELSATQTANNHLSEVFLSCELLDSAIDHATKRRAHVDSATSEL